MSNSESTYPSTHTDQLRSEKKKVHTHSDSFSLSTEGLNSSGSGNLACSLRNHIIMIM